MLKERCLVKNKIIILMGLTIIILLVVIAILANSNCKIEQTEKVETPTPKDPWEVKYDKNDNFVFLGDSITDFYPLEEMFGKDVPLVNSGIAGYKTDDLLDRLEDMVYRFNPSKVFILIGTNDLKYSEDTSEKTINNIKKIINDIKKNRKKTKIYVQSIYPVNRSMKNDIVESRYNDEITDTNNEIKAFCKEENITYIDLDDTLKDNNNELKEEYTYDGLHPSTRGYVAITKKLIPYLNE